MADFCQIQWLGQMEYGAALALQKELVAKRSANEIPNTLLLLEHPPTFTIGIDGHREHLLINRDELSRLGIAFYQVERGGSIMYHGPGQLVVYPIVKLGDYGYSYHQYIDRLESVIIRALSAFKTHAFRQSGQRGIWVLPGWLPQCTPRWVETDDHVARIAAIGVKVNNHQITSHGFSINIDPNLEYFDLIMPRGVHACHITSLRQVLHQPLEIGVVVQPVIQSFCELFELEPLEINPQPFATKIKISQSANFASLGANGPVTGPDK